MPNQRRWSPLRQGLVHVFMQTFSVVEKTSICWLAGASWLNAPHKFNYYVFQSSFLVFGFFLGSFVHLLGFFAAGFSDLLNGRYPLWFSSCWLFTIFLDQTVNRRNFFLQFILSFTESRPIRKYFKLCRLRAAVMATQIYLILYGLVLNFLAPTGRKKTVHIFMEARLNKIFMEEREAVSWNWKLSLCSFHLH